MEREKFLVAMATVVPVATRKQKAVAQGVNVIVQHNMDGTVTAKAVTPTEYSERDFTSYIGQRAPKSLSMNDIGSVTRRHVKQNEPTDIADSDEDEMDDVDGVFHVRRMIRDNSMELFSLPECRVEPADPERSGRNRSDSDDAHIDEEMKTRKGKTFKPLMIFPGGENIPERDCDPIAFRNSQKNHQNEIFIDVGSTMTEMGYAGMSQENNVAYHHRPDSGGNGQIGMPAERVGPIGDELEKGSIGNNTQQEQRQDCESVKVQLEVQGQRDLQSVDLPDSMKNADMYESLTGPTTSQVVEALQTYEAPDYHRLIPELGISEGSLAAGDNVLLAASGKLNHTEKPMEEGRCMVAKDTQETSHRGFIIPKESIVSEISQENNVPWETNLRVSVSQVTRTK